MVHLLLQQLLVSGIYWAIISTSFSGKVENMGKFENNVPDIGQCRVVIIIIIIIIIIITLLF